MKIQHIRRRTIRRLGTVVLGLTALLAVLCLHPVASAAQTSDSDEKQQSFREKIVESWKWKPRSGIGLTTEEYAREYLAAPSKPQAVVQRSCEYLAEKARFECSDKVVDAHTLTLPELKTAGKWTHNADNIRWILDNSEELGTRGFRFPEGGSRATAAPSARG